MQFHRPTSEDSDQSYAITTQKSSKGKTLNMIAVPPDLSLAQRANLR
jgi:hypothetical protein